MKHCLIASLICCTIFTSACAPRQGQNSYRDGEIGISRSVEYGTVQNVREVEIQGKASGAGTLLGAGVGAGGGSYVGNGSGNAWATAGAAVAGAIAGTLAERAINDRTALEYTLLMQSGETKTIVQEIKDGEPALKPGQHAMLQYCDHGDHGNKCSDGKQYQRLLPVKKIPPYVKKKRKLVKG